MSSDTDKKDVMYHCWWTKKKEKIRDLLFSTTKALVGTLMTVGDVNDIFPIAPWPLSNLFSGKRSGNGCKVESLNLPTLKDTGRILEAKTLAKRTWGAMHLLPTVSKNARIT